MEKITNSMLRYADEETKLTWASRKLESLTDYYIIALDLQGWKIVSKDDDHLWPFYLPGCACPDWCEDYATPTPTKRESPAEVLPFKPSSQ